MSLRAARGFHGTATFGDDWQGGRNYAELQLHEGPDDVFRTADDARSAWGLLSVSAEENWGRGGRSGIPSAPASSFCR